MASIVKKIVINGGAVCHLARLIPVRHTAKYGRTFLTYLGDNPRLITKTKRGTKEWTLIYNRRTAAERSNKREKVDYKLESARHRSTMMWYMRTFAIMMCQHIDAWRIYRKDSLALKSIIFG